MLGASNVRNSWNMSAAPHLGERTESALSDRFCMAAGMSKFGAVPAIPRAEWRLPETPHC